MTMNPKWTWPIFVSHCLLKYPSFYLQDTSKCTHVGSVASVVSDSLQPYGLQPARLFCPWDSLDKNTGESCHALFQGIFPTQGSNQHLLHCRQILCCWAIGKPLIPQSPHAKTQALCHLSLALPPFNFHNISLPLYQCHWKHLRLDFDSSLTLSTTIRL